MLNVIADLSHNNSPHSLNFSLAYQNGLRAVIHKATEGTYMADQEYAIRRQRATAAGLMWGAYHFGVGGDGKAQADYFLLHAKPEPHDLLVLDWERNKTGSCISMDLAEAEQFVLRIFQVTNRYPGIYTNTDFLPANVGQHAILTKCWLWLARWDTQPPKVPTGWAHWTMWQYTNATTNPPLHPLPGIGACDLSGFNGDIDGLKRLWGYPAPVPAAAAPGAPQPSPANALAPPLPAALAASSAAGLVTPPAPAPVATSPPQAGILAAPLQAIQQELPKLLLTVAGGVPVAKALHNLVVLPIDSIKTSLDQLLSTQQGDSRVHILLHVLVVAGCYVARLVAADVAQRINASTPGS